MLWSADENDLCSLPHFHFLEMAASALVSIRDFVGKLVRRINTPKSGYVPLASKNNSVASDLPVNHLDANDESLQRYKESLGLGGGGKSISDPNDPRQCIILSLTMNTEGREPVTIDLAKTGAEKTLKDHPFKIKEGAKFTMSAKFKVQHQILSGLHYVQIVKRKGLRVSKDQEMLVWFLSCTLQISQTSILTT
jgi:hypothetical protein